MTGAVLATIGGFALVLLAVAFLPVLGARLRLPTATLQASLGVLLGLVALFGADADTPLATSITDPVLDALNALLAALSGMGAQGVLAVFLPPLLFDAALRVDTRQLMADLAPVLLLAVVAVVLTTALVALGLVAAAGWPWLWAALLAALVATTDPSAVLGAFREVGAPRRLQSLVEGESLLNDAAAIVFFVTLIEILRGAAGFDPARLGIDFVSTFLGGAALGAVLGYAAGSVVARVRDAADVAVTVSLALPYLTFVVAEQHLGVSGVVAVVLAGLVLGRALDERVAPALGTQVLQLWGQLANWAGALIVVGAMLLVPVTISPELFDWRGFVVVLLGCAVARVFVLYVLIPALTRLRMSAPVDRRFRLAMLWGGLRGAVTVALALTVAADASLPADLREQVAVIACAFVLVTLFIQAPTLPVLLRALGLGGLSRLDLVLRERAGHAVSARLEERLSGLNVALGLDVSADVLNVAAQPSEQGGDPSEAERSDRILAAIASITEREAERYRELYDDGVVGRALAPYLLRGPRALADALRTRGLAAYSAAAARELAYDRRFRLRLTFYRRLGWRSPLAGALAQRYELVLIRRAVLTQLRRDAIDELALIVDERSAERVDALLSRRLTAHQEALEGLRRQYPSYARELEERFLRRAALRVEAQVYRELRDEGLLSGAAYLSIVRQVSSRRRVSDRLPSLDLRVDRGGLFARVPYLSVLDERTKRRLRRALRPGFAVPGERLIRRGEIGDAMYFIIDGAVRVQWPGGRRSLGSGDVFGEIALVTPQRRTADVVAITYLQYLRLSRDDFQRLANRQGDVEARVAAIAQERERDRGDPGTTTDNGVSRETDRIVEP